MDRPFYYVFCFYNFQHAEKQEKFRQIYRALFRREFPESSATSRLRVRISKVFRLFKFRFGDFVGGEWREPPIAAATAAVEERHLR